MGFFLNDLIVSAALSVIEKLKYPRFHGICFIDEIFSFFNLVIDFFSKENFWKQGGGRAGRDEEVSKWLATEE